jgi:DNA repair exonuclease SbcCD ATPase subunit
MTDEPKDETPTPAPVAHTSDVPVPAKRKRAPRPPSRSQRWADAVKEVQDALSGLEEAAGKLEDAASTLHEIQQEFSEWKDNLDGKFEGSALVEKLDAVCELAIEDMHSDISNAIDEAKGVADECEGADLPLGFGRD